MFGRIKNFLGIANWPEEQELFKDTSGNVRLVISDGTPTGEGYAANCLNIDKTNGLMVNGGTATTAAWASGISGVTTLDGAFDGGKVINGATTEANAVGLGGATDYFTFWQEGANDIRIGSTAGANMTIVPAGGTMNVTGIAAISGNCTVGGDLTVTGTINATVSVTSAPLATITADCTVQAGQTFTVAGTAGSQVLTVTAGDAVLSDGSLTITDADNATSIALTNNTITSGALIDITSTSLTTGTGLRMTADGLTSGTMVLLDSTTAGWAGGYYLRAYDGAADDFSVGQYGAVVIAGNGSTDVLTVTTGDVQIDDGKLEVDTDEDDASYFKRNQATTTVPVVEIEATNASDDQVALLIDHNGTGASGAVLVDHEGTADCITVTSLAAAASILKMTCEATTGTALEVLSAANQTTSLVVVDGTTGDFLGADGVGLVNIASDGALAHANASCLNIAYSGTGAATGLGTSLRIVDTGATATSYAVYISAATGEALSVAAGTSIFAEQVELSGGFKTTTGAFVLSDSGAASMDLDGGAANDTFNIGSTTATDVVFHGSGAAGEDMTWDSSGSSLIFATGAALVLPQGTGSGGSGRQDVTGSLFYETDAKKLWVYDGAGWVGVAVV